MDCSNLTQIFLNQANTTQRVILNDEFEENTNDLTKIRNVTNLISDHFAEAYLYCHLSVVDIYIYVLADKELYDNSWTNWLQAFIQNMVSKMIPLNQYSEKITIATENEDQRMVWYLLGKVTEIMLQYEPIEDASMEEVTLTDIYKTLETYYKL